MPTLHDHNKPRMKAYETVCTVCKLYTSEYKNKARRKGAKINHPKLNSGCLCFVGIRGLIFFII